MAFGDFIFCGDFFSIGHKLWVQNLDLIEGAVVTKIGERQRQRYWVHTVKGFPNFVISSKSSQ